MCDLFDREAVCSLQSKLTLMQISPSFSVPTDITFKLSDGKIDAHKMILAAVSPVFEKMFYGDFKEGKSSELSLPSDNYKVMKILIDCVYNGKCEMSSLDDIIPLLEVVDRYQINKVPFQHMIGETVLAKLNSSNYLTLLPKFADVMSEEANRKAAEKVIRYTKYDFTKDCNSHLLPEEILLPLLLMFNLSCYDLEIFDFLVRWYNYQANTLGRSMQLTSKLFRCVRYSLIIPQLLISKVAGCDVVDKQLISDAMRYIYTSTCPLGEYSSDEPCKPTPVQLSRKPDVGSKIEWVASSGISIEYKHVNVGYVTGTCGVLSKNEHVVAKSKPLSAGVYSFSVNNALCYRRQYGRSFTFEVCFAITKSTVPGTHLYSNCLEKSSLVSLYVCGGHLFAKCIAHKTVVSTYTSSDTGPFCIHILRYRNPLDYSSSDDDDSFNFSILVYGKNSGLIL